MLYFEKPQLLSYSHTPVFLEAGLRYRIDKKLTVKGVIIRKVNDAVQQIISAEQLILNGANDYDDIYLAGQYFGKGRITNISFQGGTLIPEEEYTYDIECYEDGNLFNALNGVYQGLTWPSARKIESIDESFDYSEAENGDKTYNHSFSIKYRETTDRNTAISMAKVIASEFFSATTGLGAFLNSYTGLSTKKKFYTETYDVINTTVSIEETLTIPKDLTGNYSYGLSYNIDLNEDGFVNVTENIDIQGLTKPPYAGAEEGFNALKGGSYSRCSTIHSAYGFSDITLYAEAIAIDAKINKFKGEINLSTTFTNNPRYQSHAIWERTLELNLNESNYYVVSERGSVRGFGRPNINKYNNALDFYNTNVKSPAVDGRLQTLYATTGRVFTLYLQSSSFSKNEFQGTITYEVSKTDDDRLSTTDIRSTSTEITIRNPVHLTEKYDILNFKEIVQTQKQSTLGQKNISIQLQGKRGTPISTYISAAKLICSNNEPVEEHYISNVQYSFSPNQNNFNFNLDFVFVGNYKEIEDIELD